MTRRTAGQAFVLHEKLVALRVFLARMDGRSRVDDCDRYFSRAGRRRGGRGVLERPPVAGLASPARAKGTPLPGPLALRARTQLRTPRCHGPHREIDKGPAAFGQALVYVGSAGRTRTCDMVVNSQTAHSAQNRTVYAFLQIP